MTTIDSISHCREERLRQARAAKYADIMLDWTFKKVFGREKNKELLIALINNFMPTERQVKDLTYLPTELLGMTADNKDFVMDLRCESSDGTQFIVEVQHYRQRNFFKRCVAYAGAVYWEQAQKGKKYANLEPVYVIALVSEEVAQKDLPHTVVAENQFIFRYALHEIDTGDVPFETSLDFVYNHSASA